MEKNSKSVGYFWKTIVLPLIVMGGLYFGLLWGLLAIGNKAVTCVLIIKIIGCSVLSLSYLLGNLLVWRYVIEDIKLEQIKTRNNSKG
ncbi:MAG: hypothetical protein IKY27_08790 [Bacteroidales bacterium]|nr:hypothetical protein [Bacteroidales bacterium]